MNPSTDLRKVIQEMLLPEFQDMKIKLATTEVEIKRLNDKIDNMDKRMDSMRDEFSGKMDSMRDEFSGKMDSMRSEFSIRFDALERELSTAINIHERLAALEAKIGH